LLSSLLICEPTHRPNFLTWIQQNDSIYDPTLEAAGE
jgi:hypothetical protein